MNSVPMLSLTLVINFGTVLSTKALVLQSFIIHIKLLHHIVIKFVPTSAGATTKRWEQTKMEGGSKEKKFLPQNWKLSVHA